MLSNGKWKMSPNFININNLPCWKTVSRDLAQLYNWILFAVYKLKSITSETTHARYSKTASFDSVTCTRRRKQHNEKKQICKQAISTIFLVKSLSGSLSLLVNMAGLAFGK